MSQPGQFTTTNRQVIQRTFEQWKVEVERIVKLNTGKGLDAFADQDWWAWYGWGVSATTAAQEVYKGGQVVQPK